MLRQRPAFLLAPWARGRRRRLLHLHHLRRHRLVGRRHHHPDRSESPTDCACPPGWAMTPQCDPLALPPPPSPLASCATSPSDPASLSFSKVFRDFRRKKRTPKRAPKGEVVAARMFALLVCARLSACCLCVCAASGCRFVSCLELSRAALCGGADGRGWGTGGLRSG